MPKLRIVLFSLILTIFLTGCNTYLDVTPEQHAQIVEYAAGLLLKYDRFYESNLVTIALPTPKPVATPTPKPMTDEPDDGRPPVISGSPGSVDTNMHLDLTDVIGKDGLVFNYAGTLVTRQYPNEVIPGEYYFAITATQGSNLLVLRFNVTNTTSRDIHLDMAEHELRLRIGYNGENISGVLFTLLEYDMSIFQGMIAAGETIELVILCEAAISDSSDIQSIEFYVRSPEGSYTYNY